MKTAIAATLLVFAASAAAPSLEAVRAEPDPEKRARAALEYADAALTASRTAYMASDYKKSLASLDQVRQAAELCLESLDATGKNARKSPKHFKRAEIGTNELLRRLRSLENDFGVDDRPRVLEVEQRVQEIHDELIARIMGKKK